MAGGVIVIGDSTMGMNSTGYTLDSENCSHTILCSRGGSLLQPGDTGFSLLMLFVLHGEELLSKHGNLYPLLRCTSVSALGSVNAGDDAVALELDRLRKERGVHELEFSLRDIDESLRGNGNASGRKDYHGRFPALQKASNSHHGLWNMNSSCHIRPCLQAAFNQDLIWNAEKEGFVTLLIVAGWNQHLINLEDEVKFHAWLETCETLAEAVHTAKSFFYGQSPYGISPVVQLHPERDALLQAWGDLEFPENPVTTRPTAPSQTVFLLTKPNSGSMAEDHWRSLGYEVIVCYGLNVIDSNVRKFTTSSNKAHLSWCRFTRDVYDLTMHWPDDAILILAEDSAECIMTPPQLQEHLRSLPPALGWWIGWRCLRSSSIKVPGRLLPSGHLVGPQVKTISAIGSKVVAFTRPLLRLMFACTLQLPVDYFQDSLHSILVASKLLWLDHAPSVCLSRGRFSHQNEGRWVPPDDDTRRLRAFKQDPPLPPDLMRRLSLRLWEPLPSQNRRKSIICFRETAGRFYMEDVLSSGFEDEDCPGFEEGWVLQNGMMYGNLSWRIL